METNTWPVVTDALPALPPWVAGLGVVFIVWFFVAMLLKCYVLWHSARRGERWWFIGLFFVNTLGILELIYLALHHKRPESLTPPPSSSWQ